MKIFSRQKSIKNKYYHLLAVLIVLFFITPFNINKEIRYFIFPLMFLSAIIFSIRALEVKRPLYIFIALTGALAVILSLLFKFFNIPVGWGLQEIPVIIFAFFLLISIALLISKMFSVSKVTSDTIAGGISVYLLLGFLWTILYYAVYIFDCNAFSFPRQSNEFNLFYFSFSTLTTLGYGDIYPINKLAMSLSNLEVVTGQMYIAIFIARLVGLHSTGIKQMDEKC